MLPHCPECEGTGLNETGDDCEFCQGTGDDPGA